MRTRTWLRGAFAGATALIVVALSGVLAAVAAAAPAVISSGKTSGYPTDAPPSVTTTASVIVTIAVIVATAGVIAWAAFGLDRRDRAQLRVVDGAGETVDAGEAARSEQERRKAA
jgi:hypothetical protein